MLILFRKIKNGFLRIYNFIFHGPVFWYFASFFLKSVYYTRGNESGISFKMWILQKVIGYNKSCYWPVHFTSIVKNWKNIYVGIDAAPGISSNCYIDATNKVVVDDYAQIAPNVSLITVDPNTNAKASSIYIGKYSRVGMGSIIKPGVILGDFTTVSAGSVVTKSFERGYCVIGGSPAEVLVDYSSNESIKEKFIRYTNKYEYHGYIQHEKFSNFRKKNLWV